jgi:ribosome production factor 2
MAPTNQQAKSARAKLLAGNKPPKARVQRYLKSTEPQLRESAKHCLLLQGLRCPTPLRQVLRDIHKLQAPNAKVLSKSNPIVPFETDGQQSLEFLMTKNDCSLVVLASSNKKRPNNLVLARTFDRQILDMIELAVLRFKSLSDYGGAVPKKRIGSKPLMLFCGDLWQQDETLRKLQNMLIDFYRGQSVDKLVVTGLDHLMTFTAARPSTTADSSSSSPLIHQRTYFMKLIKNPKGGSTPTPTLVPCGPDLDFQTRRTQWPSPDLAKASLRQPSALRSKKKKNLSTNLFGERLGRLHLTKQDVAKMGGRKAKALRRAEKAVAQEEQEAVQKELDQEKDNLGKEFQQVHGFHENETKK